MLFDCLKGNMYLVSYCYIDLWARVLVLLSVVYKLLLFVTQLNNLILIQCSHIFTDDGDLCLAVFSLIGGTSEELGTISN